MYLAFHLPTRLVDRCNHKTHLFAPFLFIFWGEFTILCQHKVNENAGFHFPKVLAFSTYTLCRAFPISRSPLSLSHFLILHVLQYQLKGGAGTPCDKNSQMTTNPPSIASQTLRGGKTLGWYGTVAGTFSPSVVGNLPHLPREPVFQTSNWGGKTLGNILASVIVLFNFFRSTQRVVCGACEFVGIKTGTFRRSVGHGGRVSPGVIKSLVTSSDKLARFLIGRKMMDGAVFSFAYGKC